MFVFSSYNRFVKYLNYIFIIYLLTDLPLILINIKKIFIKFNYSMA